MHYEVNRLAFFIRIDGVMRRLAIQKLRRMAGRLRRWLVPVAASVPAVWFLGLLMEIHSADVGPALYAEQGRMYYLHAYLALIAMAGGVAWGWWKGRR